MPVFSQNEINEAKRRVEDMRRRSREYSIEPPPEPDTPPERLPEKPQLSMLPAISGGSGALSFLNNLFDGDDSLIILLLIFILRREGADNSLILALLYILL